MPTIFFFFLLLLLHLICASSLHHHHRRILHQPFFPLNSFPPTEPPSSSPPQPQQHPRSPQPKYPFSSTTPNKQPFFPFYPSPPPPSPGSSSAAATFPANISNLIFPQAPRHKPISPKVVAIAVILALFSAAFFISIALLLYCRKRHAFSPTASTKTSRSNSHRLFPTNAGQSNGHQKGVSATSSEFLYLGTLVNSCGVDGNRDAGAAVVSDTNPSPYRKLGSPELQPLPPLSRQNLKREVGTSGDEEEEEFYSPRGSSGEKESLGFNGSGSRRTFVAVDVENFGSRGSSSSTPSYPTSPSLSPRSFKSKSPDPVITVTAPPPPPPKSKSPSPSPPLHSPENQSPARNSGVSRVPPPPPPPPPPPLSSLSRFWESQPLRPAQNREATISRPPVLVTPSKPVVFQNPAAVSPGELVQNLASVEKNEETPKPKLKPLHWDKVRASSDRAMVWDQLKSSSFQLNEEMIETLFVVKAANGGTPKESHWRPVLPPTNQENRVLDPKKSQNIAILLRALNVTIEEVCEALLEGNADTLGTELLESLLKMAPTKEEERKLKEYDDSSPYKLGSAEKFLKAVLDIPFAFKRVEAMLYIANFDSEVDYLKRSFTTLEAACEELRNSKMFLKLLDAVLKTGNRMNVGTNRGDAQAFKLDTLLKLVDVKGTDGKTTLLHFVVQEIIRAEGSRLSGAKQNSAAEKTVHSGIQNDMEFRKLGLQVVAGLSGELTNVKKAAAMDSEVLSSEVSKLARGIANIGEVMRLNESTGSKESSQSFSESMNDFLKKAEEEIIRIQAQESVALSLVKEITEYFHGNSAKEEAHPFRIFLVVRDFLSILDQVCKEVGKINERTIVSSARQFPVPVNPTQQAVFPRFHAPQQYSSSDDESTSSS